MKKLFIIIFILFVANVGFPECFTLKELKPNTLIYILPVYDYSTDKYIGEWGVKIKGNEEYFIGKTPQKAIDKAVLWQKKAANKK